MEEGKSITHTFFSKQSTNGKWKRNIVYFMIQLASDLWGNKEINGRSIEDICSYI